VQAPAKPLDEEHRLAALDELQILDSDAEASFDALTALAAEIAQAPLALISLIDAERQWFKSCHGGDFTEAPREISFCGHVVANGGPLLVPDATRDERFADNPLVVGEPKVAFYFGLPVKNRDGYTLGTLCVIDHQPRELTARERASLDRVASQVAELFESRRRQLALERAHAQARNAEERAKESERAAREGERRLRAVFEGMVEGVVLQGANGEILEANPAAQVILGLSHGEMVGRTSVDPRWVCVREDGSPFPGEEHPSMEALRTGVSVTGVPMGVHKPSGELTWIRINAFPLKHEDGEAPHGVVATFHDLTAERALLDAERHVARRERLVTAGTLAAGVGHEINNPLTYVDLNLDQALASIPDVETFSEVRSLLREAKDGTERIGKIVRGMKTLSRGESAPSVLTLSSSVDAAVSMAQHETRGRATVRTDVPEDLRAVGDEAGVAQILVNLIVNAAHAFVETEPDANVIEVSARRTAEGSIRIAVTDNGPGISESIQSHIFDPFFTTKAVGRGTGLGLSVSQRIARDLGGDLVLASSSPKGTEFHLFLLEAKRTEARPVLADPPRAPETPRRGRVLIIDDERLILRSLTRVLEKEHDVVGCLDPREALKLLLEGADFDLVLCDLSMPYVTGAAIYRELEAKRPELATRTVMVTGTMAESDTAFLDSFPNPWLKKPVSMDALVRTVNTYVHASRRAPEQEPAA